jgi:hypothetical protein
MKKLPINRLHTGTMGAPATFEMDCPMNLTERTINTGYKTTNGGGTYGSWPEGMNGARETTDSQ